MKYKGSFKSFRMLSKVFLPVCLTLACAGLSNAQKIEMRTQSGSGTSGYDTSVTITGTDVPESGLCSAYYEHTFSARCEETATDMEWQLTLPLNEGTTEDTVLSHGETCIVPVVDDDTKYKVNSDGDIEGMLHFSCKINGEEHKAAPFRLLMSLKPLIEYARIDSIHDNSPINTYDAYYTVKYFGADHILVSVEEDYNPNLRSQIIMEPYIATGVSANIKSRYMAWLDFTVVNNYGSTVHTIELLPGGIVNDVNTGVTEIPGNSGSGGIEIIEAYGIDGNIRGIFPDLNELHTSLPEGVYIIRRLINGTPVETRKFFNH